MRRSLPIALVVLVSLAQSCPCWSQAAQILKSELVVGTKETPPFAMKAADGTWQGISIDLWRRVANDMRVNYRIAESTTVEELLDGVTSGRIDVAVAALTVTGPRSRVADFTSPFYATGLGIAVPTDRALNWLPVMIQTFTSLNFARAVLALLGLALITGIVFWLIERKQHEDLGGGITKGLSSGVWWAAATMTRRGNYSMGPRTLAGRLVAILWMITSIVAISVFTAAITSALTVKHLQGTVHGVGDLSLVRVGAVNATSTQDALAERRIAYRVFATPQDGLKALQNGTIDAFVYDRALLAWLIRRDFPSVELLETTFDPQYYAFAMPSGSPFRAPLNVALLDAVYSAWWKQSLFMYLGEKAH
jgi:polar amino acid transport system substrate-binding protein